MSACRSCGAPVIWALSERGRAIPVDAQSCIGGNITLKYPPIHETDGGAVEPRAVVGTPGSGNYVSHFATCPDRAKWRKR
jgi:hypothetical protein